VAAARLCRGAHQVLPHEPSECLCGFVVSVVSTGWDGWGGGGLSVSQRQSVGGEPRGGPPTRAEERSSSHGRGGRRTPRSHPVPP
jgi:hypothetical protein